MNRPSPKPAGSAPPNELLKAVIAHKTAFFGVAFFSGVINLLYLAPALYMMQVYDRVLVSRSEPTLLVLTVLVLGLFLLMGLLENFRSAVLIRVGNLLDDMLSKRVFNASFERNLRGGGANAGQAMSDLTQLRQFFTGNGLFAFFDAPWISIYLAVIFMFHPYLGWFSMGGAALLLFLAFLSNQISKEPLADANRAGMAANHYVTTNLKNAEAIEAMGMFQNLLGRWYILQSKMLAQQSIASDRSAYAVAATKFVRLSLQSGILGLGAYLVIAGMASPGVMIAASILMGRALAPVELVIGSWKGFIAARGAYERLTELLKAFPERKAAMQLPRPRGVVTAENVYVTPPGSQAAVLKGLSFQFGPGEILGVIGPSASGKSSLARAMVGVWGCQVGAMRLDGVDIFTWDKSEVGPALGYLPQDIELFEGTIAENISRFNEPDAQKVIEAAKSCGLHELILQFPKGYDTPIGEGGGVLSGGQRQRVALARAIYGNPSLIVLDEPNSNLDDQGEDALIRTILEMKEKGSTIVLVTHRSSVLKVVDKLMILRDGQIVKFGSRDEVLQALAATTRPTAVTASSPGGSPSPSARPPVNNPNPAS